MIGHGPEANKSQLFGAGETVLLQLQVNYGRGGQPDDVDKDDLDKMLMVS